MLKTIEFISSIYKYILYLNNTSYIYNSMISVTYDHRIISVNIRLILRANHKKSSKIKHSIGQD